MTIRTGIIGGAGYTGGELIRLLLRHPGVSLSFIHSRSQAGEPISKTHRDLVGDTDLCFTDQFHTDIDALFLCLGHGESRKFLEENPVPSTLKVIDLANDFRLQQGSALGERHFVYGLPEWQRDQIRDAGLIANPGCFATAVQLGLLPLAAAGLLEEVYTTGITGSTGAGQSLSATSHFSWRANNIQAYKTLTHQHLGEIGETLSSLQGGRSAAIHFVPWRGDFTRGIFVSSQIRCSLTLGEVKEAYRNYYQSHPFTHLSEDPLFLKQVVNTNKCLIQLEKQGDILVVHSAIDNLVKGASGQAVQNLNLVFGLDECQGLDLKASYF
jgi:N-acetyl-gamma-glutamyl-phosphate reductase